MQAWLQGIMDEAIENLDGTHFELAERVKKVESMIAPSGGAAAPYYTSPSEDFSRPGRTWLPTMGQTRFPVYDLVSTWYHEGFRATTSSSPSGRTWRTGSPATRRASAWSARTARAGPCTRSG